LILPGETMLFPVDVANDGTRKYASLRDACNLWAMDFEMNCMRYGCLFVKSAVVSSKKIFNFNQANPEPLWSPAKKKKGDALPANILKVGFRGRGGDVKFISVDPTAVVHLAVSVSLVAVCYTVENQLVFSRPTKVVISCAARAMNLFEPKLVVPK